MEELPVSGLVGTRTKVVVGAAEIDDVAEQVAHRILRHGPPEPGADPPERDRAPPHRPAFDGQPPDEHEAAAAQELLPDGVERSSEPRQVEVLPTDAGDWTVAGVGRCDRGVDLGNLGLAQDVHPVVAPAHLVGPPGVGSDDGTVGHRGNGRINGLGNRRHVLLILRTPGSLVRHCRAVRARAPAPAWMRPNCDRAYLRSA